MRLWVFALGLSFCACGKIDSQPEPPPPVNAGGRVASEGGTANGAVTSVGGAGEAGGRGPSGAAGGMPGSGGNASGASGEGGASGETTGAAGSPAVDDDQMYDACGCGCCGVPVNTRCYYPELGESLGLIKAEDQAIRTNPGCVGAGCSSGVHYVRCETPAVEEGATYSVAGYSDDKRHVRLNRTTLTGRCTALSTVEPGAPQDGFPLELPGQYGLTLANSVDGACSDMTSARRVAIGARGLMKQSAPQSCAYDFDFTLFFLADDGTADAARFAAQGIALPGMANDTCP